MGRARIVVVGQERDTGMVLGDLGPAADGQDWRLEPFSDPAQALAAMSASPPEVVVACGPDLEWLETAAARWPRTARVALGGSQGVKGIIGTLARAHQCLRTPYDPRILRRTVDQCLSLLELLDDPGARGALGSLDDLPTLPKVYWRLVEATNDPHLGINDIVALVGADAKLAAKILEMAKSAFFASHNQSQPTVRNAIGILGPEIAAGIALSSVISRALRGEISELQPLELSGGAPPRAARPPVGTPSAAGDLDPETAAHLIHDIGLVLFSLAVPPGPSGTASMLGIWACP